MTLLLKRLYKRQTHRLAEKYSYLAISYRIAVVILIIVIAKKITFKSCFNFLKCVADFIKIYREILVPLIYYLNKLF